MNDIIKVSNRIKVQLAEYLEYKSRTSKSIANSQKLILDKLIKVMGYKSVGDITTSDLSYYYDLEMKESTPFTTMKVMQAIRAFIRFHKRSTTLKAAQITDHGIIEIEDVGRIIIEIPQVSKKLGRPMNLELVKKVKLLRDEANLSFRSISKALGKDVKNVYLMYKYKI